MKWGYKIVMIPWNDNVEAKLNELGMAGFELVAFFREESFYKAIFKKPIG
jgi:hypothetical protein